MWMSNSNWVQSAGWPRQHPPSKDMDVEVIDGLPCPLPFVYNEPISVFQIFIFACNVCSRYHKLSEDVSVP